MTDNQQSGWAKAFKAYDIRGRVPSELNPEMAYRLGRAFAEQLQAKKVVVGRDVRLSSAELAVAVGKGLMEAGCDVLDIGLGGTEMVYFATSHLRADGGIMVTASHNPLDYNGMKLVRRESRPISGDSGLHAIRDAVCDGRNWGPAAAPGTTQAVDVLPAYVEHLLSYIEVTRMKPLKVVMDAGNGGAGLVLRELAKRLPLTLIPVRFEPDGNFPQGIPNPLLPENRSLTAETVRKTGADLGIAWDGDFDRCFFFDETGEFIEGYYVVGLLAAAFLQKTPGAKIIHDPRLIWNTRDIVKTAGGMAIQSKTGHAFIKERMRAEDAVYGGEMSAHHYFRDFFYCDSGMIPWLLVLELMSRSGKKLSELVDERMRLYPCSGEINRELAAAAVAIRRVEEKYLPQAIGVDRTDGVSLEFATWRFNLRSSNTEPVVRLNVETRGDAALMREKTTEILVLLDQ
ncbi:MAG: phosphomannomutase [Veillonellaceae bacterium]|nr:phosphomannomutase [Veillonellaceae bacterium]